MDLDEKVGDIMGWNGIVTYVCRNDIGGQFDKTDLIFAVFHRDVSFLSFQLGATGFQ